MAGRAVNYADDMLGAGLLRCTTGHFEVPQRSNCEVATIERHVRFTAETESDCGFMRSRPSLPRLLRNPSRIRTGSVWHEQDGATSGKGPALVTAPRDLPLVNANCAQRPATRIDCRAPSLCLEQMGAERASWRRITRDRDAADDEGNDLVSLGRSRR
jgi:hypothetical protein